MRVVMATNRSEFGYARCAPRGGRSAFTLVDLMTSMAIIAVLIALLLPSMAGVREATRRVVCLSNQRQIGLGSQIYSEDNKEQLPATQFVTKYVSINQPQWHQYRAQRRDI